jgi:hypothetical protein
MTVLPWRRVVAIKQPLARAAARVRACAPQLRAARRARPRQPHCGARQDVWHRLVQRRVARQPVPRRVDARAARAHAELPPRARPASACSCSALRLWSGCDSVQLSLRRLPPDALLCQEPGCASVLSTCRSAHSICCSACVTVCAARAGVADARAGRRAARNGGDPSRHGAREPLLPRARRGARLPEPLSVHRDRVQPVLLDVPRQAAALRPRERGAAAPRRLQMRSRAL